MDKNVRNRIQGATLGARALLEREFAEQLEGVFDIRLDGSIAADAGSHLDEAQRVLRNKLVAAVEHLRSERLSKSEAVASYLREAAFTTLNRFVALKMLEARELTQQCISRGEQSTGFKEFTGLAQGLVQLPDGGYRLYIESLFDEIGREVRLLFDRRDPASLLWPRRQTLLDLLDLLNTPELAEVWKEDETIGWVYQYFNSDEERRQMRAESQAPRNSRELAVRNQFFTPRYVVEFLTDNTLGRIWYEMRQGKTRLVDECDYLVRWPREVFLASGQQAPLEDACAVKNEDQEALLKKTVYVPFREPKDPRELKILDPACGSGHFLLYAFDLLISIYEEGWAAEGAPIFNATERRLREDYANLDELRKAIPDLILRYNLHGIDIDPRADQIAALALWMRAQRAYNDFSIPRSGRPPITKTNIVVGEPMPGEKQLRQEFISSLDRQLGQLVGRVFDRMEVAGEAGSLLRIEDEIQSAIRDIYAGTGELFRKSDELRWQDAEGMLVRALRGYAEQAQNGRGYPRRLFAEDAAHGFAFADLCRQRYDAILMNPPFGDASEGITEYVSTWYPRGSADLGAVFVQRGLALLRPGGRVGAITNRTLLAVQGFAGWRRELLDEAGLHTLVDLGHGVLDAMVETAMYVCGSTSGDDAQGPGAAFLGLLEAADKQAGLRMAFRESHRFQWRQPQQFRDVPGAPWAYWVPVSLLRRFKSEASFLASAGLVCQGTATADDFRFYRLRWEVPSQAVHVTPHLADSHFSTHRWSPIAKGGEYSLWWDDIHLVQEWANDGSQIKNFVEASGKPRSFPKNLDKLFRRGTTYPYRTTSAFGLRLLPAGLSFSVGGWAVFSPEGWTDEEVLATYNTRIARYLMEVMLGQGDSSASGTAARNHVAAAVGGIPWPRNVPKASIQHVRDLIDQVALSTLDETALFFCGSRVFRGELTDFDALLRMWWEKQCDSWRRTTELYLALEHAATAAYDLTPAEMTAIAEGEGASLADYALRTVDPDRAAELFRASVEELTERAKRTCGAKRYTVKKAYFIDRSVDLASHIFQAHPFSVIDAARQAGPVACGEASAFGRALLSWVIGLSVGRFVLTDKRDHAGPSTLAHLPQRALEEGNTGLPIWVDDPGHAEDMVALVRRTVEAHWDAGVDSITNPASRAAGWGGDLRKWCRSDFFAFHVSAYSKSRRKAPIYWQLATPSASYSVWLYYHRFTKDTFYTVLQDYVTPKVDHEERKLTQLVQGAGGSPTAGQRKEIAEQETFVQELRAFREQVARIAPLWNPDLDDGVIINFAPLWRLVPQHRAWQKECKECWDKLVAGDYDWAHLAMHLWPERVVPKCATDRSLAIAHGLDDVFWVEGSDTKWQSRKIDEVSISKLVEERTSAAIKEALGSRLELSNSAPRGLRKRRTNTRRALGSRSQRAHADPGASTTTEPGRTSLADADVIKKVRNAIAADGSGASKAGVLAASGVTDSQWNAAIKVLLADGAVTLTGDRRGARYRLADTRRNY